jgi:hypothetical protein
MARSMGLDNKYRSATAARWLVAVPSLPDWKQNYTSFKVYTGHALPIRPRLQQTG